MRQQLRLLLNRDKDSYKYKFGHVFVVGGSPGLTGASVLAANASLKIGAGLVTIGIPESLNIIIEMKTTEVMSKGLPQNSNSILSVNSFRVIESFIKERKVNVLLLGPGISNSTSAQKLCRKIIQDVEVAYLIIDADALKSLRGNLGILKKAKSKNIILTPHIGEFSYMLSLDIEYIKKNRVKLVKRFSQEYGVVLVLKGYKTVVSAPDEKIYQNNTGNPGLSKAGTGDVLAGFIAGILAQDKLSAFDSAKLGVYLHGMCADVLKSRQTVLCMLATDLIEILPQVIKKVAGSS